VCVILGQFHSEAPSLNANGGVALGIEYSRTAQHLGCNLVLLERDAGMIEGVLRQISEEFAQ
jgi:pyruvate/2-oxoglutarate dehydrogenase complex dihydrolipoamide dehydrogenase (E3) component